MSDHAFAPEERDALYKAIFSRRDVRGQFAPDPVPEEVLTRVLTAAHHAPSVGFMQPWNFIVVQDPAVKSRVHADFSQANEEAAALFTGERKALYSRLKLEGIREAPVNLCITCDRERSGPVVLGRTHIPTMVLVADPVQRGEHAGGELAGFLQHGVHQIGGRRIAVRKRGDRFEADHLVEDKAEVIDRSGVGNHGWSGLP